MTTNLFTKNCQFIQETEHKTIKIVYKENFIY